MNKKSSTKALNYSDIYLVPRKSVVETRSECDTSKDFAGKRWKLPVIPANMKTCINFELARWMAENSYFYILHRFYPKKEVLNWIEANQDIFISISVGVKKEDESFLSLLASLKLRVDSITVDIAAGHSILMLKMIQTIKRIWHGQKCPFIIAGNVTTPAAVGDLMEWGADAVKVGIGGGAACTTKNHCGFHVPMWTCVTDCVKAVEGTGVKIIADGGIRENGDIVKALAGGADFVMAGSIFASCEDAPGETIEKDGKKFKVYYGSASARNKGYKKHVEGVELQLPCNGMTYEEKLEEIKQDLQSAASYAGGYHLGALKNVEKVFV